MTRTSSSFIVRVVQSTVALAAVALIAGAALNRSAATLEARASSPGAVVSSDDWTAALKGKHRQLFDAPSPAGAIPLVHVMNYYDTYNKAFATPDKDINSVLTFYGSTTFHGLSDEMWSKYRLGEFLGEKDAKGVPYTVNPWRVAPVAMGMTLPQASIEALQKRGATFIMCNNALTILSGLVAKARGLDAATVYSDMKANVLPKVTMVPAMVIAIEQAQTAGIAYHRQ